MFIKKNFLAFIWTLVIFILCSIPGNAIPEFTWLELLSFDKLVHAGIFFVLQILYMHGFKTQEQFIFLRNHYLIIPLTVSITYGASLELMQFYVFSERSGDLADFIANSIGIIIAALTYKKLKERLCKIYSFFRI